MFELCWSGKDKMKAELDADCVSSLTPNWNADAKHHFIEGDNLEALRILRTSFGEKIDFIYIDPPYNTGQRFVYHDDFRDALSGQHSPSQQLSALHSNWLNMIYPRLVAARDLLCPSGVIFISIDDVAQAPLKIILDEIFGPQNFVQTFLWRHGKGKKDKHSRTQHQYVLAVAKDKKKLKAWRERTTKNYGRKNNPDQDARGPWFSGSISFSEQRSNPKHPNFFSVRSPSGIEWKRQWLCSKEELQTHLKHNNVYFGLAPAYDRVPRLKIFPHESEIIPLNILDDLGTSRSAAQECAAAFDGQSLFDYPKPVALIQHLIELAIPKGGTVLDFFAGSGTTGIACMRLEAELGQSFPCILVQKPEVFEADVFPTHCAWTASKGLQHNVASLTWHRLGHESGQQNEWQRHTIQP